MLLHVSFLLRQTGKDKGSTFRCCLEFLIFRSVVTLVFVLAGCLRLFAALYAGALIVLLLSQIGKNAGLCAAALKSFQSVIQRLVFLDVDFRHVFPSLQIRLAALQGPMNWLFNIDIIPIYAANVNNYFAGLRIRLISLFLTTMVFTSCMPSIWRLIFSSAQAASMTV